MLNSCSRVRWGGTTGCRQTFELAREREAKLLLETAQQHSASAGDLDAIWRLHAYLSARRFEHEGKYVFDLDDTLFLFAGIIKRMESSARLIFVCLATTRSP